LEGAVGAFAREASQSLLGLAELEKSLYEIRYELANRPAWLEIALDSALERARAA
jgi:predicted trehalose synthase